MTADEMTVAIGDDVVEITAGDQARWELPVGPVTLVEHQLERADPPSPVHLTNALAAVQDHFEDIVNETPAVLAAGSVVASGPHAVVLARVEVGQDALPPDYRLRRVDAEEVFRTLVAEPSERRRFNPGLPADHVETVIGTCCIVLAIMRRLDLTDIGIAGDNGAGARSGGGRDGA